MSRSTRRWMAIWPLLAVTGYLALAALPHWHGVQSAPIVAPVGETSAAVPAACPLCTLGPTSVAHFDAVVSAEPIAVEQAIVAARERVPAARLRQRAASRAPPLV